MCYLQLNVEDPCIICHEPMGPDDMCVLECRHSFHDHVRHRFYDEAEGWKSLLPLLLPLSPSLSEVTACLCSVYQAVAEEQQHLSDLQSSHFASR